MDGVKKRIFLNKDDSIENYENNLVTLKMADGKVYEALEPRKLFPVSRINAFITLLDSAGKEIAVIKEFSDLNSESAKVIKESLADYYLVPYITRIVSVVNKGGTMLWNVETNRGEKQIEIRDRNHGIKVYGDGCVRIRDVDDNRYVIKNYNELDKHSKAFLSADI